MTLGIGDKDTDKMKLLTEAELATENVRLSELTHSDDLVAKNYPRGVSVIWKDLNVIARTKKQHFLRSSSYEKKYIIKNVSGCIRPANLVAILGASGSGKSTLMSVLANRQLGDLKIRGDICINGKKIDLKYMKQISGFVYQDDLFMSSLTVLEHLHFAAQMKLDRRISSEFRKKLVYDLLIDVGLINSANNFIGTESFGQAALNLSGGERKRLSVATELLTDPSLLFCDEPTTGLDSYSAFKLVTLMRGMTAQRNKTIVCSIHQPNEQIFNLFDQIILLHQGEIAYIGSQKNALSYFESLGYNYDGEQNPAEYFIKSLAIVPSDKTETTNPVSNIFQQFKESEYAKEINDFIEEESKKENEDPPPVSNKIQRISFFRKLCLLTNRNFLAIKRDISIQGIKIVNKELLAVMVGLCLMGSVTLTQEGIQSMKGVIFTMVAENFFPPLYGIMNHIPSQMPVFYREYSNDINSPLVFFLSNIIALLPGLMIDPLIFTCILYFFAGLQPVASIFLLTLLTNFLTIMTSTAFGMLLSLMTDSYDMSTIISTPIDSIYMLLAGIFINLRTVPRLLSWIRYISWMTYAVEILLILQVQGVDYIACREDVSIPCLKNGTEVLEQLDFNANNLWRNFIAIISICLVLNTCAYFVLRIKLYYSSKR